MAKRHKIARLSAGPRKDSNPRPGNDQPKIQPNQGKSKLIKIFLVASALKMAAFAPNLPCAILSLLDPVLLVLDSAKDMATANQFDPLNRFASQRAAATAGLREAAILTAVTDRRDRSWRYGLGLKTERGRLGRSLAPQERIRLKNRTGKLNVTSA